MSVTSGFDTTAFAVDRLNAGSDVEGTLRLGRNRVAVEIFVGWSQGWSNPGLWDETALRL